MENFNGNEFEAFAVKCINSYRKQYKTSPEFIVLKHDTAQALLPFIIKKYKFNIKNIGMFKLQGIPLLIWPSYQNLYGNNPSLRIEDN